MNDLQMLFIGVIAGSAMGYIVILIIDFVRNI